MKELGLDKKPAAPRVPRPKFPVDPIDQFLAEFLAGARCWSCSSLRDAKGMCDCARAEVFAAKRFEVDNFERQHGDPDDRKKRYIHGAAASGRKRAALQAGLRETPSNVGALSVGQAVNLSARLNLGQAMEWSRFAPSGDELPL